MNSPVLLFGFLSLFHIIGAAVLAKALLAFRNTLRRGGIGGCQVVFMAVWATMFGGIPFLFGVQFARSEGGTILFLVGEVLVWTTAFLVTPLAQQAVQRALEPFQNPDILLILFGGGFLLTGVTILSLLTREARRVGLPTGAIVGLVGTAILGFGLWRLLRSAR